MRKAFVSVVILTLVLFALIPSGCTNKKPEPVDSIAADTLVEDTTTIDSTEQMIAETPMPKAADELFDDFIFNFAANRKLQQKRITFPLPIYHNGKQDEQLQKGQWKTERFFMRQDYYTLIFDNQRQKKLGKDTTIGHVEIEKIFFKKKTVETFVFDRINGEWKMTSVHFDPIAKNPNASFLHFYNHFSTDSAFQVASMAEEVEFTAPDPEDDFSDITGVIVPQQWPDFKPGLIPRDLIYNIVYGKRQEGGNRKLFVIRGIANGLEMEMEFKKVGGKWLLVKFNS